MPPRPLQQLRAEDAHVMRGSVVLVPVRGGSLRRRRRVQRSGVVEVLQGGLEVVEGAVGGGAAHEGTSTCVDGVYVVILGCEGEGQREGFLCRAGVAVGSQPQLVKAFASRQRI